MKRKAKKRFTVIASFEKQISETDKIKHIQDIERAEKDISRKIYSDVNEFLSDLRKGR